MKGRRFSKLVLTKNIQILIFFHISSSYPFIKALNNSTRTKNEKNTSDQVTDFLFISENLLFFMLREDILLFYWTIYDSRIEFILLSSIINDEVYCKCSTYYCY